MVVMMDLGPEPIPLNSKLWYFYYVIQYIDVGVVSDQ